MANDRQIREIKYREHAVTLGRTGCTDPESTKDDTIRLYSVIRTAIDDYSEREGRHIDPFIVCVALDRVLDEEKRVRNRLSNEGLV